MSPSRKSQFEFKLELEIEDPSLPYEDDERGEFRPARRFVPFHPKPVNPDDIIGRKADEICPHVGTYGMGGPGFFGFRFGTDWLVLAIWGADEWMSAQGRCVSDTFHEKYGRPPSWLADWRPDAPNAFSRKIVAQAVRSLRIEQHFFQIVFANGFDVTIEEASERRPLMEGSKEPRAFAEQDDLRRAVFLAPTIRIRVS